jgi:CHASE1-domain containing sensor protein
MTLDTGAIVSIFIALTMCCVVIIYSMKNQMRLEKEIRRLQIALRTERLKK